MFEATTPFGALVVFSVCEPKPRLAGLRATAGLLVLSRIETSSVFWPVGREVGIGVAVEVGGGRPRGAAAGGKGEVGRRPEAPAGAAEQHREVVGRGVRDREVGVRVGVEVGDREPEGVVAGGEGRLGAEARAGAAEPDRDVVRGAEQVRRQVGVRVAVEVADLDVEDEAEEARGQVGRRAEARRRRRRAGSRRWRWSRCPGWRPRGRGRRRR